MKKSIKLRTDSILQVPLNNYEKDFTFVVNGKEFKTNKYISDILSPKISNYHLIDPTFNEYSIKTKSHGDFSKFLNLINFKTAEIDDFEVPFFIEILQNLETIKIDFKLPKVELTTDNIIDTLIIHQKQNYLIYSKDLFINEIDFLASHLFEFNDDDKFEKLFQMPHQIFELVFASPKLKIENEDQLLHLINKLYLKKSTNCELYSSVLFENASVETINEFISIFDPSDMTFSTWKSITKRLANEIKTKKDDQSQIYQTRYKQIEKVKQIERIKIECNNQNFNGIFKYLQDKSNINDEIKATVSSNDYGDPTNVFNYDNTNRFGSSNKPNSWICFEFKKHQIIPLSYTIRSNDCCPPGKNQPRTWVIEGSNDNDKWETVDEIENCSFFDGKRETHTFDIKENQQKKFKYIRMRQTGFNCGNQNYLIIEFIEFYGYLI